MFRPDLLYTLAYRSVVLRNLNESYTWWGEQGKLLCKPVQRSRPINIELASRSSLALKSASQLPHCVTCITEPLLQHVHCHMDIPALSAKHTHTHHISERSNITSNCCATGSTHFILTDMSVSHDTQEQISKAGTDLLQAPVWQNKTWAVRAVIIPWEACRALTQLKDFITKSRQHKQRVRYGPNNNRLKGMWVFKDNDSWVCKWTWPELRDLWGAVQNNGVSASRLNYYYPYNNLKFHFKNKIWFKHNEVAYERQRLKKRELF